MVTKRNIRRDRAEETLTAYAMILPDALGLLIFVFAPIIYAFYVSLHKWNGLKEMKFIGVSNYIKMFSDEHFWLSIWITIKYALIYVPSIFCFALLFALLVHSIKGKMQQFYRIIYFIPYAISTVVAALIWTFMYDPMRGYLNAALKFAGIESQNFLASTTQALPSVAVVGIWLVLGYNMVLFLAALKDIPQSYFEAADIDGANSLQKFFSITLPLLKETSLFVVIVTTIGSFQAFDQIKVMTNGGPALATNVTVFYIFRQAFEISKLGYSSAIAFILFIIIMVLTLIQLKAFSKAEID
ncbi:MAG: sugar ABC transporter permease [Firmicutes bacterium]|nr:sugar ABC transporter permease [Bacillota bacterium]